MVGDYYSEKERWEQVLEFLRENALPALAAIAVVAAGYGGLRYWQSLQESHRLAASTLYSEVLDAFTRNDVAGGLRLADQLIRDYPRTSYADQAELAAARVQVETNQLPQAERRLRLALDSSRDRELKLVARLRLARVQVAMGHADDALKTLSGVEPGAFAARYAEVRGDALLAKGDKAGALREYENARRSGSDTVDGNLLQLKISELARS